MSKPVSPDDKPKRRVLTLNLDRAGRFYDPKRAVMRDHESKFARDLRNKERMRHHVRRY